MVDEMVIVDDEKLIQMRDGKWWMDDG